MIVENVPLARDHRLRKQAHSLVEAGCQVTVICRRDQRNGDCVPGVRVLDYRPPREGSSPVAFAGEYLYSLVMAALLTLRVMVRSGIDVVQVSSTPDIYALLLAPLRLLGRRVVFDFRDVSPEMFARRFGRSSGPVYRLLLLLERTSLRLADRVLVVNESLRRIAIDRGGVKPEHIAVVGNGPMLSRVGRRPACPELRRGRDYLCCWVGMIGPQDGVDLALRAFADLVHNRGRVDCSFVVVGVGDAVPQLRALTAELDLEDFVHFAGWAEEDTVFDYLSTADIGVEPNPEDFVSPVKAMEYMACGLPFVAFDLSETRHLAGPAALYAPEGDVQTFARLMEELLDSPSRRAAMGASGQERVRETIAWECQLQRYLGSVVTPRRENAVTEGWAP
jgi:glycosyltransferase involved in cell wall biosynthesis